jgi:aspartate-semialdehyde dehydrogenase
VTAALALLLEPVGCPTLLQACAVTSLLGASSAGRAGLSALEQQTADLLSGRDVEVAVFPHRLAYNLIPQVGLPLLSGGGFTEEEEGWRKQLARLWQTASPPPLYGTAVQSPHFYGCLLSVSLRLRKELSSEELRTLWRAEKGLKVLDDLAERIYPTPQLAAGDAALCVGRVRVVDGAALFVAAFDNVRFLALQAVRAAERLS